MINGDQTAAQQRIRNLLANLGTEHYEVRHIATGMLVYRGTSLTRAATKLEPGTCYGKGPTPREAHEQARAAAYKHGKVK